MWIWGLQFQRVRVHDHPSGEQGSRQAGLAGASHQDPSIVKGLQLTGQSLEEEFLEPWEDQKALVTDGHDENQLYTMHMSPQLLRF